MIKKKKLKSQAQILVILLLVLSILSIFILSMVTNARKDTTEKADNKIYEQYYSIAEQKLLQIQSLIGLQQLQIDNLNASLDELTYFDNCTQNSTGYNCAFDPQNYETELNQDQVITNVFINDSPILEMYQINSDSNFKIALVSPSYIYKNKVYIYWNVNGNQSLPINWIVTVDTYNILGYTPLNPAYESLKISTLNIDTNLITVSEGTFQVGQITYAHMMTINLAEILASKPASTVKNLRLKPLIGNSNDKVIIGVVPEYPNLFPTQFRKITAVTRSYIDLDSPTPVLNLEYPLSLPINPLLDYVLRAGEIEQQ